MTSNDLDSLLDIPEMRGRTYEEAVAGFLGLVVRGHKNWKLGKSLGIGSCWLNHCCLNPAGESLEAAEKHFAYCDANPEYLFAGVFRAFKVNAYLAKSPFGDLIKDIEDFFNIPDFLSLLITIALEAENSERKDKEVQSDDSIYEPTDLFDEPVLEPV